MLCSVKGVMMTNQTMFSPYLVCSLDTQLTKESKEKKNIILPQGMTLYATVTR